MVQWQIDRKIVPYPDAMQQMETHVDAMIHQDAEEKVWLLEHPPLYTAGTSANPDDLLISDRFPVYQAGRGGEYTYHGPGQRIAYVMLNLNQGTPDLRLYVNHLEQWLIDTLAVFDIKGERREGRVGIWVVDEATGKEDKIAALGIRVRQWVTFHGIALNINPDLEHFSGIVPCGISSHGVTSLHQLGIDVSMEEVDQVLQEKFCVLFSQPQVAQSP